MTVEGNPRCKHAAHFGRGVKDSARRIGVGGALLIAAVNLAEQWLAVSRIELSVHSDNHTAIGLYEKFGFKREGTLHRYAFRDGRYVDVHVMARLAAA